MMWKRSSLGPALPAVLLLVTGCAVQKTVTIVTTPPDAAVKVNGIERGTSPVLEKFTFQQPTDVSYVTATRKGYQDLTVTVTQDALNGPTLPMQLKPYVRRINIIVQPVPAIVSIDGRPLTAEPVSSVTADVEFGVDKGDNWLPHTIVAERMGFIKSEQTVKYADQASLYSMKLEDMSKDLRISSEPSGARAFIDGEEIGNTPLTIKQRAFQYDVVGNRWIDHVLRVQKPGYDPVESKLSWDDGKVDYPIALQPKRKTVRLLIDPPDAVVKIEGAEVGRDGKATVADLVFTPINDRGELRTFKVHVAKKTADAEYYPLDTTMTWDDGKTDYPIKLREVLSRPMPAVTVGMVRENDEWKLKADTVSTVGMKFVTELAGEQPVKIAEAPKGQTINSISVSPDGQYLVYGVVGVGSDGPKAAMFRVRADGSGGSAAISSGRSLDLTPTYTAAGDKIVYSSNRTSRRFSIWAMNADGTGGVTRYTAGETDDLWPAIDASAKPRLFYQAYIGSQNEPRLFSVPVGTSLQTDLTSDGGTEPKISPRNDSVAYTQANSQTGKHDVCRVSDKGGAFESLTNEGDNINPSWDPTGTKIVFASDRGKEAEDGRNNYDIWLMDVSNAGAPKQITSNGSVDDLPAFDPAGGAIYFRSNRGGAWGIWKIAVR